MATPRRLKVCDCPTCACSIEVYREGSICAGCLTGERCAEILALPNPFDRSEHSQEPEPTPEEETS